MALCRGRLGHAAIRFAPRCAAASGRDDNAAACADRQTIAGGRGDCHHAGYEAGRSVPNMYAIISSPEVVVAER